MLLTGSQGPPGSSFQPEEPARPSHGDQAVQANYQWVAEPSSLVPAEPVPERPRFRAFRSQQPVQETEKRAAREPSSPEGCIDLDGDGARPCGSMQPDDGDIAQLVEMGYDEDKAAKVSLMPAQWAMCHGKDLALPHYCLESAAANLANLCRAANC